jgi:hypothetical protein
MRITSRKIRDGMNTHRPKPLGNLSTHTPNLTHISALHAAQNLATSIVTQYYPNY